MGTDAHVVVVGGPAHLPAAAARRVADLERRWSRFRPDSEVSRLNAAAGRPVDVSAHTCLLVRCGMLGWRRSDGLFDPTVHDALVAAGYDRDFAAVRATAPRATAPLTTAPRTTAPGDAARPAATVPGPVGIVVDDAAGTVQLPTGVRFDGGGVAKGLAADLVVAELIEAGADGACVNLGGDLRVAGRSPDGQGWRVGARAAVDRGAGTLHLLGGGVATSGTLHRRWPRGPDEQHHLIDARSGAPADVGLVEATVVADTAWEAEVAAKVAVLGSPPQADVLLPRIAAGAVVADAGGLRVYGAIDRYLDLDPPATGSGAPGTRHAAPRRDAPRGPTTEEKA